MIAGIEDVLSQAGPWALVVVFIAIALESSAFLGLMFPGETLALIAGAMASGGYYSPWLAFAVVASAAIVGDVTGFTIGRYYGQAVLERWSFARQHYEKHRERLQHYFEKWGVLVVLVGRFVAVGRVFTPFAAGLSGMRGRRYVPMAIAAGLIWAGFTVGLGYALGSNWLVVEKWLRSIGAGILVLLLLTAAMVWLWRATARRQDEISAAWNRHLTGRYGFDLTPFLNFVRARLSPRSYLGLHLTLGLVVVAALGWLFGGIVDVISEQKPIVGLDMKMALFVSHQRTPGLDAIATAVAGLSNPLWLISMVAVGAIVSARVGNWTLAITAIPCVVGAYALAVGLQAMFLKVSAHQPSFELVNGFAGFPSVMLTVSTAAYGLVAYMIASRARSWPIQTLSVVLGLYIVALIGIAGLYSGLALSAGVAGFALGGCWLAICVIGILTYTRLGQADARIANGRHSEAESVHR